MGRSSDYRRTKHADPFEKSTHLAVASLEFKYRRLATKAKYEYDLFCPLRDSTLDGES